MYFVVSIHNYTTKEVECQGGAYFFLFFPNAEIIVAEGGGSSRFAPGGRNDCGKFSGQIFHPVRVAVSGRTHGPTLFKMLEYMGKDTVVARLKAAVALCK